MLIRILGIVALLSIAYVVLFSAPATYPSGETVQIEEGVSGGEIAASLDERGVVQSAFVFKLLLRVLGHAHAGVYTLDKPESAPTLAWRLVQGDTAEAQRFTIPEGSTVKDISTLVGVTLPSSAEGYLFPDTYDFVPGSSAADIVERMRARYEEKVAPLRPLIAESGHSEAEIVTMASLLEKEARLPETRRIVAGILWKRVKLGMPLQVDAVFGYIKGVDTYSPKGEDFDIDSPYNTYLYAGLPPGPIANPGLDAIEAALNPTKTDYLYYLTGADGTMHYAKTLEQHKANRKYLK